MAFVNEKKLTLQKLLTRVEFAKPNDKFIDKQALELADKIDLSVVERFNLDTAKRYMGTTLCIDEMVEDYIKWNSNACIITVNSGLSTRKTRINRMNTTWFSLDTEDMMLYKQTLGFDNIISNDILDEEWVTKINTACPSTLVIFEDYSMYQDKETFKKILEFLCNKFENVTFIIEIVSKKLFNKLAKEYNYQSSYTIKELLSVDKNLDYVKKRSSYRGLERLYWYKIFTEFRGSNYSQVIMLHKN